MLYISRILGMMYIIILNGNIPYNGTGGALGIHFHAIAYIVPELAIGNGYILRGIVIRLNIYTILGRRTICIHKLTGVYRYPIHSKYAQSLAAVIVRYDPFQRYRFTAHTGRTR